LLLRGSESRTGKTLPITASEGARIVTPPHVAECRAVANQFRDALAKARSAMRDADVEVLGRRKRAGEWLSSAEFAVYLDARRVERATEMRSHRARMELLKGAAERFKEWAGKREDTGDEDAA